MSTRQQIIYTTSKLVAHRRKRIEHAWGGNVSDTAEIKSWLENDDILRGLRYLMAESRSATLIKDNGPSWNLDVKFKGLRSLIENLAHLRALVWYHDTMIPLSILDALHTHQPSAELQIYNFQRDTQEQEQDENIPAEIVLAHSPALTAMKASFATNGGHPDLREACSNRIVANAPNLRFASFSRRLTLDGFGMSESLLRHWAEFVDLSQLENIKVSSGVPDVSYLNYAPQELTNLQHVSLNFGSLVQQTDDAAAAIEDTLTTIAPLQSLSLWSWMGNISLDTLLARHGQTLEVLQLHERETIDLFSPARRKVLGSDAVRVIREACPNLRDFTLDCDRPNQALDADLDSNAVVKELQRIQLANLHIYYDLGLAAVACHSQPGQY